MRWAADRFAPGYGTAAAITLGLATIVMTFAAEFFSHVISAGIAFAAFCVLIKERDSEPRALAGWHAPACSRGSAVTFEFQTGLVGVVLFGYALSRRTGYLPSRAAAYAGGTVLGALPMLAFNTGRSAARSSSPTATRSPFPASPGTTSSA